MHIAVRTDASFTIGSGHVMRCLTLADALRAHGAEVTFVCREHPGNLNDLLRSKGYSVAVLPGAMNDFATSGEPVAHPPGLGVTWEQDAGDTISALNGAQCDWLLVDHYGIGAEWERTLRAHAARVMVIDDLADRPHECDLLLDQNLFDDMQVRYDGLVPPGCRRFLGPRYALLRDEFIEAKRTLKKRDGIVRRILMFFGGSDPTNETEKALLALKQLHCPDIHVDVVVGSTNPNGDRIKGLCAAMPNVSYHRQIANMAELMAQADLAIGAGGSTTWERCFLGLPSLVVVVADNQHVPARAADKAGLACYSGTSDMITASVLAKAIHKIIQQPSTLIEMSDLCLSFMGPRSSPITEEILSCLYEVSNET